MVADPVDILPSLLDLPELVGKDDRALTRLQQYKNLEVKAVERATSTLGNEEFLRSCGITIEIDYEVEGQFDRLVELANRTNQLNYTKQRLETPEALADFRQLLATYGVTAGLVRVADKYGDYGIVGFFVLRRIPKANNLLHFVFSCRTMNMGIEQYIYERLQKPTIKIVQPVANPICPFVAVDWISEGVAGGTKLGAATSSKKLLLLGGCELLQLASMCSSNREEFVNTCRDNWLIRFDDPAFVLGDRENIRGDAALEKLSYWTYKDAVQFDKALVSCEIVIAALYTGVTNNYYHASLKGNIVRLAKPTLRRHRLTNEKWLLDNFRPLQFDVAEKIAMVAKSLDHMAAASPPNAQRFTLGVNTKKMPAAAYLAELGWPMKLNNDGNMQSWLKALVGVPADFRPAAIRHIFNAFLKDYCLRTRKFVFVDVENLTTREDVQDLDPETGKFLPDHLTRRGYINVASFIAKKLADTEMNSVKTDAA
jgi:hypothetical protein